MNNPLADDNLSIAVVIATKGRPKALKRILKLLDKQTINLKIVVVSAHEAADVEEGQAYSGNIEYIFGSAGLTIQRNQGVDKVIRNVDIIAFFDDDFALSDNWLENCSNVFLHHPDVVGVTGKLLHDGANSTSISWEEAEAMIINPLPDPLYDQSIVEVPSLYGCNMAFRTSAIVEVRFDERLALYGWLEDKDFSRSVGLKGRLIKSSSLIGVHLGIRSGGRTNGKRFGYSQIINPWYLYKKGTLSNHEALSNIFRALIMNFLKSFCAELHIDRLGRLLGNFIALKDLCLGRCIPEKVADL